MPALLLACACRREYEAGFQRALWTFRHQRVYCPRRRRLVHLRDLPPGALSPIACCPKHH